MNVFNKLAGGDFVSTFRFGAPLGDAAAIDRRLTTIAQITRGKGFRLYPGKPVRTVGGKTRAERKAERVERANEATATYHANLHKARDLGLIGIGYVSPDHVAKLLSEHAGVPAKTKRPRAKKVTA
ncbi:hypothetical protein G6L26_009655 [Agrobacterium radiobacter]|uniref:hypothetical protein n=1 Tax=Agrobacterium tumefaciens complex TaxID=1183400 RepID=UPI00080FAA00|nr:hypothetical protein [Agrobacterium tumefaciens]NTA05450.1 hypothetical protein [Agrobacterium tumefaciens]NTA92043.1 hypothetical protein [Agrobacterium tumefaciens]OCJ32201.1 hypothetical protein A6U90_09805 [Agrobacterium tumefaciens]